MEDKERYCTFYECWCNDVDANLEETSLGSTECNYRCKKCPYSEYRKVVN